jgi:fibronectin-binding autotransporter adhesin
MPQNLPLPVVRPQRVSLLSGPFACPCAALLAVALCAGPLQAETLSFDGIQASGTASHTIYASDWAEYLGGTGTFAGANQGGRLYWRGAAGDGQYMHFNLSSLSGQTVVTPAYLTLQRSNATWGGGVDGSFVATADGAWTAGAGQTVPGATAVASAVNATGSYNNNGSTMSWGIGSSELQSLIGSPTYQGLAVIGGSGSQLHFDNSMAPYLTVKTGTLSGASVPGVITVSGGGAWNAANYSFVAGDAYSAAASLRINGAVAGGTSGAGSVTINGGNVLVNQAGGVDNAYWAVDSTTINAGGTLTINGHSHIHNLTLAGGELGGTGVSGQWGGWSFDDATTVTGGTTSIISARQVNLDSNGTFTVDTGSTLNFSGSIRIGSLTKNGGGEMLLTGDNGYSGGTIINGGSVLARRSTLGSGAVVIENGATLVADDQWVLCGPNPYGVAERNIGTLTINAGGTLHLDPVNGFANGAANLLLNGGSITGGNNSDLRGALFLFNGNEQITAGGATTSTIAASVGLTGNNNTITSSPGSTLSLTGQVKNSDWYGNGSTPGGLIKAGAGTLVLDGDNTYSGTTSVQEGTVLVNGTHTGGGLITVSSGATLGGNGMIGDVDLLDGGALAPGNSAGHLIVNKLTMAQSSILNIELGAPSLTPGTGSDFVTVGDMLTLHGTLNIQAISGFGTPVAGDTWRIMTVASGIADNGITLGNTPALTGNLTFALDFSSGDDVFLTVVPEAGTAGLAALGALLLRALGRRRR